MATKWERFQHQSLDGNVVLNFTSYPIGDLHAYAHAYQEAANTLVEAFRTRKGYSDADACPIVFLYRHSIELYLKEILHWGGGILLLQGRKAVDLKHLFRTHRLKDLVVDLKRVFAEVGWLDHAKSPHKFGTYAELEKLILEFEQIDPKSFAFRYPIDKTGAAPLPEQFHFNVVALGEETDAMLKMLEGAADGVYEMFQDLAREHTNIQ